MINFSGDESLYEVIYLLQLGDWQVIFGGGLDGDGQFLQGPTKQGFVDLILAKGGEEKRVHMRVGPAEKYSEDKLTQELKEALIDAYHTLAPELIGDQS